VPRSDNLTTFMYRMSGNLGALASWKPHGLSRPVMGLLYFYLYLYMKTSQHLLSYLVQFLLEQEMFQTNALQIIKTQILCSVMLFYEIRVVYEIV